MKHVFPCAVFFIVCSSSALAAIDGTVINRTSGKPEGGVSIALVKPGQAGMQTLANAVSDASGRFAFDKDQPGSGPQLLQANYKGVTYNKLITPNIPTSNIELDVYEATKSPAVAHVAQRMLLIEPSSSRIAVNETVIVQNDSSTTYDNNALGALRFYLPPSANGQVRVNVQGPQGMPLPRAAEKTAEKDVFKVNFPVKPGQTEFEVNYILPAGSPFTFRGRAIGVKGMPAGPLRLVVPPGVTLSGKDIQKIGTEPKTQLTIYNVAAADNFSADITGTGSVKPADGDTVATDTSDQPQVVQAPPRIYRHMTWLVVLAFATLGLGLVLLFRSSPIRSPYGK